jgi:hypothetical protein
MRPPYAARWECAGREPHRRRNRDLVHAGNASRPWWSKPVADGRVALQEMRSLGFCGSAQIRIMGHLPRARRLETARDGR